MFNGTTGKVIADSGANIDDFVLAVDPVSQSTATPVNADTLDNHAASYFATASALSTLQDEVDAIDLSIYAPLASPALTGTPTAPTATSGTSTTQIATTAFVQTAVTNAVSDKVDVTGDTMTGILTAQNNTSYTTKQVRNVFLSTADPTSSDGANGDIWIVYTA